MSIKVAKNSLAYVGMFVGNGKKGAVTAIDKSNAGYDVLTIKLLLVRILPRCCIIQCNAVDGLKQSMWRIRLCLTVQRLRRNHIGFIASYSAE